MRALIIPVIGVLLGIIIYNAPRLWVRWQTSRLVHKREQARHLFDLGLQDLRETLGDDVIVSFLSETHRAAIQRFLHKHDKEWHSETEA